jgi:mannitol/fructose-specific phosphotransferase system IIA component (Ntr-type)
MAVVLADLLDAKHVTLELAAASRDEALRAIVAAMEVAEPEKFLAEVVAREEVHTTLMGKGVAFPHARTDLVSEIVLGIARSAPGVPFGPEGELAQLIFVIGVPKKRVNDYLVCVGALARLTKAEETRARLMAAESAEELVEILRAGSLLLE